MEYTRESIEALTENQREFFLSGKTLDVKWRVSQLKKLKSAVIKHESELTSALREDLGRSDFEAYLSDIGPTLSEIDETVRGVRRWAKPERHFSGISCFPSVFTNVYKMPYGVTLIISPFNFPVLLTLGVLAASISGGNTAVIKTSSKSASCTKALKALIADTFPPEYVTLVEGGHDVADMLLETRFDKIFYTGSPSVGRHVMEKASANLTPVALELGGETGNWCIVRADADIRDAARKIAFFKLLNAGQICININQVAVAKEIADEFVKALAEEFSRQIGGEPLKNEEYPKLISENAYEKCASFAREYGPRIVYGGKGDASARRFEPTVIYPVGADEKIVQRELFCPLLPVVPYDEEKIGDLLSLIARREHPLALYLFTKDKKQAKKNHAVAAVRRRLHKRSLRTHYGKRRAVQRHGAFGNGRVPRRMGVQGIHTSFHRAFRQKQIQSFAARASVRRRKGQKEAFAAEENGKMIISFRIF